MRSAALLFLLSLTTQAEQNQLTPEEKAAGWQLLFDGKTSAGWMEVTGLPFPSTWRVEDGCLRTVPTPGGGANQDIRSVATFRSFELRFDWKIARGGNSGVKYMVQKTDRWQRKGVDGLEGRARGFEYQLLDDALADEVKKDSTRGTASLYSYLATSPIVTAEPELFHESRIIVRGDHVEHWYDGARVLSFSLTDPGGAGKAVKTLQVPGEPWKLDTMIALQNHGTVVWFRNLKIRRLD